MLQSLLASLQTNSASQVVTPIPTLPTNFSYLCSLFGANTCLRMATEPAGPLGPGQIISQYDPNYATNHIAGTVPGLTESGLVLGN